MSPPLNSPAGFSPHRNFAENLRGLCARHGSIAAVCTAIGMNRQQFNKYLAGSTLPNAPALEKICGFFAVAPESLFSASAGPWHGAACRRSGRDGLCAPQDAKQHAAAGLLPFLHPMFYTPWPRDPGKCVRAALFIHQRDGVTLFSRFTKFRHSGSCQRYHLSGQLDSLPQLSRRGATGRSELDLARVLFDQVIPPGRTAR
jgi:transcriptional regulator with XRE-family HTH domain